MAVESSPHTTIELDHFCENCSLSLKGLSENDEQTRTLRADDQSFETFRESARQQCFICSILWNLSEKHPITWSNVQPVHWTPMRYIAKRDSVTFFRLNVIYHDPLQRVTTDIRFRIISTEGIYSTNQINCGPIKLIVSRQPIQATISLQKYTTKHIITRDTGPCLSMVSELLKISC
jgi:hypothetical protein